jgi:HSP20 family molecular chaperone IbpA
MFGEAKALGKTMPSELLANIRSLRGVLGHVHWTDELLGSARLSEERTSSAQGWQPELDIYEHPEGLLLTFAVPGVVQEDIDVHVAGTLLTVQGRRVMPIPENAHPRRVELRKGHFTRQVRLPASADASSIRSQLLHGLLLIHIPKPPPARVKVEARG